MKHYYECLKCKRTSAVISERLPTSCDLCGSGDIRIIQSIHVEKIAETPKDQFLKSNEIFKKAYRKAFGETV